MWREEEENVDTEDSKELEVSFKKPNSREKDNVINTYNRVVKQINEEICFFEAIKWKVFIWYWVKKNIF